jgi:hypothetical protein
MAVVILSTRKYINLSVYMQQYIPIPMQWPDITSLDQPGKAPAFAIFLAC